LSTISGKTDPVVQEIRFADVAEAVAQGFRDFRAAPLVGLAIGTFYAAGGVLITLTVTALGMSYLAYPLAAGFALIGPFLAIVLYDISRRLETGEPIALREVYRVIRHRSEIGWMAFVVLFIFVMWMYQVRFLIALLFGINASFSSLQQFISAVLTTNEGLLFLLIGNLDGAILSLIVFALTVVSFPLLLERDIDCVTAMITSVRAVVRSPAPMIGWAATIALVLVASILPTFLGLIFTLPILGHATWHLYHRIVVPLDPPATDEP
jgi:uncharacterized membrane protein